MSRLFFKKCVESNLSSAYHADFLVSVRASCHLLCHEVKVSNGTGGRERVRESVCCKTKRGQAFSHYAFFYAVPTYLMN